MFKGVGLIGLGILACTILFSGCSNKPDLKHWSKATATYLVSQKYPEVANSKKRISVFSGAGFAVFVKHKIIDNYNIGMIKFGKIVSCNSNMTTHAATCWYTVIFVPNKTYYKVKEKLIKNNCIIHNTGEAEALFQQTVNKRWYIYVLHWQWNKPIVQWHYPY
jgi:hypothetical protein